MLYHAFALLLGSAIARNLPARRDEWQAPSTCIYLTNDAGWKGLSKNFCQTPSYCVNTLPTDFQGNVSSAGPDEGQTCFLYSAENCKGDRSLPIIYPGVSDLTTIGFNDNARSFRCWVMCGYVEGSLPPQSVTSLPASSSSFSSTAKSSSSSATSSAPVSITTTINGNVTDVVDITVSVTATPSTASTLQPVSISQTLPQSPQPSPKLIVLTHTYADGSMTVITTTLPAPTRS